MSPNADAGFHDTLRARYLVYLQEQQHYFDETAQKAAQSGFPASTRQDLRARAHKLAGNGATYGFDAVSQTARALEEALDAQPNVGDADLSTLLQGLKAACESASETQQQGVAAVASAPATDDAAAAQPVSSRRPNVLIVDDDPLILGALGDALQSVAEVSTASDAEAALNIMHEAHPDLLLLDDQMPGALSGLQLQEKISDTPALQGVRTVMITASNRSEAVMRALNAGAIDYIVKPFDTADVVARLHTRLRRLAQMVFVVDDDLAITDLLSRKLRSAGYSVRIFGDGLTALAAIEEACPDLIVLDQMLPGLDGATILQKIRAHPRLQDIPVVILSARRHERDVLSGLALGATDYVVKPFNPQEMVARCVRLLDAPPPTAA
ncbi:hypothetical protein CKO11_04805 [Rhodobacter sp. TJ_12]|uniref:response regulator n=1 Tax=Rhodobacter sp. TJ_12 TaxID=2029399 RepID=UPI001CBEE334|nr:response regulator [Rhodobacter sp. TJ_12]MBZ4021779.1 hypothetical protein [Rhodobacter sp. TJ_12]